MNRNWWEEATPKSFSKLKDYFWPAKRVALAKLSKTEREHLAFGEGYDDDGEGYDDDSD